MKFLGGLSATLVLVLCLGTPRAEEKEARYSIKEVMKKAHGKDGLRSKVLAGDASVAEKKELVELYVSLALNKPPKGEANDWKDRTAKIVKAARAVEKNPKATKTLATVTSCKACHTLHK